MAITVQQFLDAARKSLQLEVEAGEEFLGNVITEEAINRPGLALAGFQRYFARKRIQVFGLAEHTYLKDLNPGERKRRLNQLFRHKFPALVVTRNRHAADEVLELARRYHIPVLRSPLITGRFMNAATVIIETLVAPRMRVHATTVDILGVGVLIEGEASIGKSETALTLIERGHSLVADDITVLRRSGEHAVVASAVDLTRHHMEIRGVGIIHAPSLFGVASVRPEVRVDLIVRLQRPSPAMEHDRSGLTPKTKNILGVDIPMTVLPVAAGRVIAHVVEVAAMNQRLKLLGYDAAKELDERLMQVLSQKRSGG